MNSIFLTPRSEPCTQRLSPPPPPPPQRNYTPNAAFDGKDDSFSAHAPANKRARIDLPMMPPMDDNDNVSFAYMLPKTRLSRRNTGFEPSWQSSSRVNGMSELADSVDVSEALRLMFCKSVSSNFSLARGPSKKRSNSLIFVPKAA
jgi:hypothetical protein